MRWVGDSALGCGAFHEVPQFGTEAGGGGPVHDVVVDGDGEVQNVVDDDLIIDCDGASAQSAHDDHEDASVGGAMANPAPPANMPAAVTLHGAGRFERLITAYIAGTDRGRVRRLG